MMDRENILQELTRSFGLQEQDIYLLDLLPLIEMIWADGKVQKEELALLYEFAVNHLGRLSQWSDGVTAVSIADVNRFLDHFLSQRPSQEMLEQIRSLTVATLEGQESDVKTSRKRDIISYCMDIAACVNRFDSNERPTIEESEKRLLIELTLALNIQPDQMIDS